MIPRYEEKAISTIWSDEYKFATYLEVELAILKSFESTIIPPGTSESIKQVAKIDIVRIQEIEAEVKHDVIAFCTSITENIDPAIGKYFHYGVTSSDIIDSATNIQIKRSLKIEIDALKELLFALKERAVETQHLITMGRSHGMDAEPMSFGQKFLGHYAEFNRRLIELEDFYKNELTVQFSGAVGNYTITTPEIEKQAAMILGMQSEPLSTQVIPRDKIAKLISINALLASAMERLAVEIRHLHRSDVAEVHEGFGKKQKGSSTMPHKKNPISSENLTGISRVLRSHQQIALENIVLWHERDISHSSAERLYLPDNFGLTVYAIKRLTSTVRDLVIHEEIVTSKVLNKFSYLSSYYLHYILARTTYKREDIYHLIQQAAFKGDEQASCDVFYNELCHQLLAKKIIIELPRPDLDGLKNIYCKHTAEIFSRF